MKIIVKKKIFVKIEKENPIASYVKLCMHIQSFCHVPNRRLTRKKKQERETTENGQRFCFNVIKLKRKRKKTYKKVPAHRVQCLSYRLHQTVYLINF